MHLFLYGVLRADVADWPFLEGLGQGHSATTHGTLHAIPDPAGWYPALTAGDGVVHGMLHAAGAIDLAVVDAFEGDDYERRELTVWGGGSDQETAQAYLWNAPLPQGAIRIAHGDFAQWLRETGCQPITRR